MQNLEMTLLNSVQILFPLSRMSSLLAIRASIPVQRCKVHRHALHRDLTTWYAVQKDISRMKVRAKDRLRQL